MMKLQKLHDKSLNEIINNPSKIGLSLSDIEIIMKEPFLFRNGIFTASPDLIFACTNDQNYIIEYKNSYNPKGYEQLTRANLALYGTNLKGNVELIFAYRNKKERIIYEKI